MRSPLVQEILARLITAYVELVTATLRWRLENFAAAEAALAAPEGVMVLFWHGRIAQAMACRPFLGDRPRRVLISLSRDGAFIAKAADRLGVPTIRGSTGRDGEGLAKGGVAAFRAAVKTIGDGAVMLVTPDGPRGPAEAIPEGPVQLARAARCAVFGLGLAARPAIAMKSWDGARIPLPFARAVLVVAGPLRAPVRLPPEGLGALQVEWRSALQAAMARAEALLAGRAGEAAGAPG